MSYMVGVEKGDCWMLFYLYTGTYCTLTVEEKVEAEGEMTAEIYIILH